jgi:hypothetical protein
LIIREDFVGRLDLGEQGRGAFCVAMVAIGVEFERLLAVCLLESVRGQTWSKL